MTKQHIPYRSRDEIISIILEIVKESEPRGGILRTRLMMTSNVSNIQLHSYLQKMLDTGLITCDSSKVRHVAASARRGVTKVGDAFHITEKGERYLDMVETMKDSMGPGVRI